MVTVKHVEEKVSTAVVQVSDAASDLTTGVVSGVGIIAIAFSIKSLCEVMLHAMVVRKHNQFLEKTAEKTKVEEQKNEELIKVEEAPASKEVGESDPKIWNPSNLLLMLESLVLVLLAPLMFKDSAMAINTWNKISTFVRQVKTIIAGTDIWSRVFGKGAPAAELAQSLGDHLEGTIKKVDTNLHAGIGFKSGGMLTKEEDEKVAEIDEKEEKHIVETITQQWEGQEEVQKKLEEMIKTAERNRIYVIVGLVVSIVAAAAGLIYYFGVSKLSSVFQKKQLSEVSIVEVTEQKSLTPMEMPKQENVEKTKEVCRRFARYGQCGRGDKCRYVHVFVPAMAEIGEAGGDLDQLKFEMDRGDLLQGAQRMTHNATKRMRQRATDIQKSGKGKTNNRYANVFIDYDKVFALPDDLESRKLLSWAWQNHLLEHGEKPSRGAQDEIIKIALEKGFLLKDDEGMFIYGTETEEEKELTEMLYQMQREDEAEERNYRYSDRGSYDISRALPDYRKKKQKEFGEAMELKFNTQIDYLKNQVRGYEQEFNNIVQQIDSLTQDLMIEKEQRQTCLKKSEEKFMDFLETHKDLLKGVDKAPIEFMPPLPVEAGEAKPEIKAGRDAKLYRECVNCKLKDHFTEHCKRYKQCRSQACPQGQQCSRRRTCWYQHTEAETMPIIKQRETPFDSLFPKKEVEKVFQAVAGATPRCLLCNRQGHYAQFCKTHCFEYMSKGKCDNEDHCEKRHGNEAHGEALLEGPRFHPDDAIPYMAFIETPYMKANGTILSGQININHHALLTKSVDMDKMDDCEKLSPSDIIKVHLWTKDGKEYQTEEYKIGEGVHVSWDDYAFPLKGQFVGRSSIDWKDKYEHNDIVGIVAWDSFENFKAKRLGFTSGAIKSIEKFEHDGSENIKILYKFSTDNINSGGALIVPSGKMIGMHSFRRDTQNGAIGVTKTLIQKLQNSKNSSRLSQH